MLNMRPSKTVFRLREKLGEALSGPRTVRIVPSELNYSEIEIQLVLLGEFSVSLFNL